MGCMPTTRLNATRGCIGGRRLKLHCIQAIVVQDCAKAADSEAMAWKSVMGVTRATPMEFCLRECPDRVLEVILLMPIPREIKS